MLGVREQQQAAIAAKDCGTVERVIQKVRVALRRYARQVMRVYLANPGISDACPADADADYTRFARSEAATSPCDRHSICSQDFAEG